MRKEKKIIFDGKNETTDYMESQATNVLDAQSKDPFSPITSLGAG